MGTISVDTEIKKQVNTSTATKKPDKRGRLVPIGFIVVLAGWLTMVLNPWISLSCALLGLILSCIGVRIAPGPRRNFAITTIIAASVQILVFAIFAVVLSLI